MLSSVLLQNYDIRRRRLGTSVLLFGADTGKWNGPLLLVLYICWLFAWYTSCLTLFEILLLINVITIIRNVRQSIFALFYDCIFACQRCRRPALTSPVDKSWQKINSCLVLGLAWKCWRTIDPNSSRFRSTNQSKILVGDANYAPGRAAGDGIVLDDPWTYRNRLKNYVARCCMHVIDMLLAQSKHKLY